MRAELANLNHCAVAFLSCTAVNLGWYDSIRLALITCYHRSSNNNGQRHRLSGDDDGTSRVQVRLPLHIPCTGLTVLLPQLLHHQLLYQVV